MSAGIAPVTLPGDDGTCDLHRRAAGDFQDERPTRIDREGFVEFDGVGIAQERRCGRAWIDFENSFGQRCLGLVIQHPDMQFDLRSIFERVEQVPDVEVVNRARDGRAEPHLRGGAAQCRDAVGVLVFARQRNAGAVTTLAVKQNEIRFIAVGVRDGHLAVAPAYQVIKLA
jgi:hypothetical protein